ncbi:hypothetical protein [Enhygromyxa salina]|uniref:Uncharacterized protein n=1 Tax=Enhygromyxa salina TaxID=215803 RepID=A0A2S9YDH1_9BACT|nr:hypothetical protein [Enhygromyxa salina]PRQ03167.1 hypothetical protein ENSA7_54380 [Enhygromyxa salina]
MPTEAETTALVAQDGFDEYYTEKLWNWIPGLYHEQDANTPTPGTLREIVESMGAQSADLRRSLDRIWENFFVELADDDALEALGEIVATRMVHALNRRARRVDVARTIYYRRRKGTPRVLESLITDITGWAGAHLETRRRLGRTYHLLEPGPDTARGMFTRTPRGGWADLRSPRIPALGWSAFEELNHTPDFRRYLGKSGRVGIPRVNVHLYRARAFKVTYPTVVQIGDTPTPELEAWQYALDPSGRAVALFQPADRPTADSWTRMREWQMPKAIDRRLLDHSEFEWGDDELAALAAGGVGDPTIAVLQKYANYRISSFGDLVHLIDALGGAVTIPDADLFMRTVMISDCGRSQLYGENQALALNINTDNAQTPLSLTREMIQVGNLDEWGTNWDFARVFDVSHPGHALIVDPARGTVISQSTDSANMIAPVLHYGFPGEVGAGTYDRRESIELSGVTPLDDGGDDVGRVTVLLDPTNGVEELVNNKTFEVDLASDLTEVEDYRLQAKNLTRSYLLYSNDTAGELTSWTINAATKLLPTDLRCLVLEGLWIGLEDSSVDTTLAPVTAVEGRLILSGTWDRVEISHCTLDPGGELVPDDEGLTKAIQYVTLEIAGFIEELIIDRSIVGPIVGTSEEVDGCAVGKLTIRDSIVLATDPAVIQAIDIKLGEIHMERSTVIGGVTANRIYASDSLITGAGIITDRQHGCFRFSAGVQGGWPHPYESYLFSQFDPVWFESARFGDSNLLRLTELAPAEIQTGAENHCEMGVWNHLFDDIKRADLRAKFGEFMPFDLIMQLVTEN